jgi:hypothetical protein
VPLALPRLAARAQRKTWEGKGHSEVDRFVDVVAALRDFGEIMRESGFFFKVQNIDFDFRVKSVPGGANKKPTLRGQPSSVTLLTEDSRGGQTLQEKFRAKSKYFQAKSEARTVQKEYRITLNLEFKPQALAQLE